MMKIKSIIFFLCIFSNFFAEAQKPYFEFYSLLPKRETLQVNTLLQDGDGYIWFATTRGLFRFDGTNYVRYTTGNHLPDDNVTALASDSLGRIWMGFVNGKISYIDQGQVIPFNPEEGTSRHRISDLLFDHKGRLWFSTVDDGLYYYTNSRLYRLDEQEGIPDLYVYDMAEDSSGNVLAGTDGGIAICTLTGSKASVKVLDHRQGLPDNIVRKIIPADDYYLFATEDAGVLHYDPRNGMFTRLFPEWKYGTVSDIVVATNQLWIATSEHGILVSELSLKNPKIYPATQDASLRSVNCLLLDLEHNIWAGSKSGVSRTTGNGIEFIDEFGGNKTKNILAVSPDNEGNIWFSSRDGLFKGRTDAQGKFVTAQPLAGTAFNKFTVISLYTDVRGYLWAGLYGEGVLLIDPRSGHVKHLQRELRNGNVLGITGKGDDIWMATLGGATKVTVQGRDLLFRNFGTQQGLSSDFIYQVFVDSRNRVWLATDGKGVDMFDGIVFHHFENGLPSKIVYGITEDNRGKIWANVQGNGLYLFDGKSSFEEISPSVTPRKNEIHSIATDRSGNIVVSHDDGIDLIDPLNNRIRYLGEEAGLKDKIANLNAVTRDGNGALYIGTFDGIVKVADGSQFLTTRPRAKISGVRLFDKDVPTGALDDLSYNENNLTFDYVGLWYQNPSDLYFSYKLENYDREWISTKNNSVTYSQLPPGNYSFRVQVSETESFENAREAVLTFQIASPFWRTATFYILVVIVAGISAYGLIKFRERKLRYNNMLLEARVRARTREIQRQHDEIQAQNEEISAQAEEIHGINENLEQLVHERTAELETKNKALEEYAFINAHKLRSPVASILGLAHLMSKTSLDPEGREINQRLQQAVDELDDIVRSITQAIERGERQVPIEKSARAPGREKDQ